MTLIDDIVIEPLSDDLLAAVAGATSAGEICCSCSGCSGGGPNCTCAECLAKKNPSLPAGAAT